MTEALTLDERLARVQKGTLEERLARLQKGTLEQRLARLQAANPFQEELNRRNPFQAELNRRESEGPETAGSAFIKTTGRGVANLALGFPQASGTALAFTAALPALVPGGESFREQFETEKGRFPASLLRKIPAPTFEEIFGITEESERMREQFPKATGAGDVAADVITLLTGRLPLAKGIAKAERKLVGKTPDLLFGGAIPKITDPGAKRLVKRVIDSKSVRLLARGAGRSLEAGFEAAALDLLKGDAPLETAMYVAGAQAGGSVLLTIGKGLTTGGPLRIGSKLALSAVSAGALIQLVKNTTPGGQDNLIDSIETGFEKVMLAVLFGAVAGAVGAGRLRGTKLAEDLPKLTDAIAAIPRASMISLLENYRDAGPDDQQTIELVIGKLSEDPEFFGTRVATKLQSAMENNRFAEALRELQNNKAFKQKLFSLAPPTFQEQRLRN